MPKTIEYCIDRTSNRLNDFFPKKWACECTSRDDVLIETGGEEENVVIENTKSKLNPKQWSNKEIKALVDSLSSENDKWNFDDDSNVLCVWSSDQKYKEPPMGFVAFSIDCDKDYGKKGEKSDGGLQIKLYLIWVQPEFRGLGVSKHIATHLIWYLIDCNPSAFFDDVEEKVIIYAADYYTKGGETFSSYIENAIEWLADINDETCPWPGFNDIIFEAGY